MLNHAYRLFNTLRYLKLRQITYRIRYVIQKRLAKLFDFKYSLSIPSVSHALILQPSISHNHSYQNKQFTFLNLSKQFHVTIDWNYSQYGKLWTYNLSYFDFLHQESMNESEGLRLIVDFINQSETLQDALEPFPISLRGINWIKFLVKYNLIDSKINDSLYAQYHILTNNLEYHLLGNHLLENAFSLLFGAYYFQNKQFYNTAKQILIAELNEQILSDGAHFELSPMYHQIMLFRLLDCINLLKNNPWIQDELLSLLEKQASIMLGWLETITFLDGSIPLFNDSTNAIAPTTHTLNKYAKALKIQTRTIPLDDSGYRKIIKHNYECIIDIGNIGPDYIPGHAHSDTFNFELYVNSKALIVDTGISTYEINEQRQLERSTSSHNTVMIDNLEQSDIWGGFRVAKRAKICYLLQKSNFISATHNGYKANDIFHNRTFNFEDNQIVIHDTLLGSKEHKCKAYFHFHPDIFPILQQDTIQTKYCNITYSGHSFIEIIPYLYASEFNKRITAYCVIIYFTHDIITSITINADVSNK